MGKYLKLILIAILVLMISVPCYAQTDIYQDFTYNAPSEFSDYSIDDIGELTSLKALMNRIASFFVGDIKNSLTLLLSVCGIVLLITLLKNVHTDNSLVTNAMTAAICATVIALCFSSIEKSLSAIGECIDSAVVFCSSAVPVILTLCISSGNSFSGAVFSTSVSFISTVLEKISDSVLVPLTVVYLSFAIIGNFSSNIKILSVDKQIKKFIKWVIGSFITLFSISMSLQSFLSASSDSMLKRSVKSAVGSFIPVVGNTLSSSVESIFTIASNSKTGFSVLGIVIILTIFLPAISFCTCYGLSLSAAKMFALFLNEDKTANVISSVADVFYLLSGICATCVVMMIVSFLLICLNLG